MRNITCAGCGTYLGEIRDAKLRKNIAFLCIHCEDRRKALKMLRKGKTKNYYDEIFDVLRGK